MDFEKSYETAKLKGRDKDFEKEILRLAKKQGHFTEWQNYDIINNYVKDVIKHRWTELEKILIASLEMPKESGLYHGSWNFAINYCQRIIGNRWPELENKLLELTKVKNIANFALFYCKNVIGSRWEELEKVILDKKTPACACSYAVEIINGRWNEAEDFIKNYPNYATYYAKDAIKGRWIEAENSIKTHTESTYHYAKDVIKGRWIEAEKESALDKHYGYNNFIKRKILNLLKKQEYDEILKYADFQGFTNIIKNAEKKQHIPDVIKNVIIANAIVKNDKDTKQFMMQEKIFKQKMKSFLADYKGLLVEQVIDKL